jgi:hypothetical protein
LYEEIVVDYEEERRKLFQAIQGFIDDFATYGDNQVLILMLKCLGELSQLFGVELTKSKLVDQCAIAFNQPDFRVRIEALRAIAMMAMRLGQHKFQQNVVLLLNLLTDSEDLVVIEAIKMFNQFVKMRLLNQEDCLVVFQIMYPYLLHPNRQMREGTVNFIVLIWKMLSPEEFYCQVRGRIRELLKDEEDIYEVSKASDILDRLRPPLQPRIMVNFLSDK